VEPEHHLLCIHGRGQEHQTVEMRNMKRLEWLAGLAKGLTLANYSVPPFTDAIFPYYGQVLWDAMDKLRPGDATIELESAVGSEPALRPPPDAEPLSEKLIIEVAQELGLEPPSEEIAIADFLGSMWVRNALQFVARKTNQRGLFIYTQLRDVAVYLGVPAVRKAILDLVQEEIPKQGKLTIIGHSLGSVVAYDLLTTWGDSRDVELLVTAGSPLGLRTVRRNLLDPNLGEGKSKRPPGTSMWVNAYDVKDIVAIVHPLSRAFSGVKDEMTHNPSGSHSIQDYLSDPDVAGPVGKALALNEQASTADRSVAHG